MKIVFQISVCTLLLLAGCASLKNSVVNIFDGKSLQGWQNFGGGTFYVEDGAIVGEATMGPPNSFLATNIIYADFELEVDYKVKKGKAHERTILEVQARLELCSYLRNLHPLLCF